MPEPVPNPLVNNQDIAAPSSGATPILFSQDIDQLKQTVDKFKATGQVDPSELDFAKKEILPKLGLKPEEISDLGPVGVMVRLQAEVEKGSTLPELAAKPQIASSNGKTETNEGSSVQKLSQTPTEQKAEAEADLPETLTNDQIQKLTHDLSSEIDDEIKRQMAEKHALDLAQEKIDQVLASNEPKPLSAPAVEEKIQPVPPVTNEKLLEEVKQAETKPKPATPVAAEPEMNLDPLSQSVNLALQNLKEGDRVGSEWILKKILTTSFGNNKSPFYELENHSGAKWTLSPEEMKETLRSQILAERSDQENEKPPLGVSKIKPASLHPLEGKKIVPNIVTRPLEQIIKTVRKEQPNKPMLEPKVEIKKVEVPLKEAPSEVKTNIETVRPTVKIPEKTTEEKVSSPVTIESTNLNEKQISFISKVHADKESWRAFTTFTAEQWGNVNQLYREGKLIDLGIDAHPLIDKLTDPEFTHIVDIRKGDNFNKVLENTGYNLTYTADDSKIVGAHLIANHQLLVESARKAEVSGFTGSVVPSDKEIIDLIYAAENGNHEAFYQLQEPLHQLPVNGKFRVIKPDQLEKIKDFFKK